MLDHGERVYDVIRQVRPLTVASVRVVAEGVRPHGLTVGGRAVLELLAEHGARTVPALAADLGVSRQAVQRVVDDLRVRGHVVTRPNPAHRRSVLVETTDQGAAAFAEVHAAELERLGRVLAGVSDDDLATTVRVLAALTEDVRRQARASQGEG